MPVEYYEWNTLTGGTDGGGGGGSSGPAETFTGTAGAAAATVTFTEETVSVTVMNVDDTGVLEYSLDGVVWIPLQPYASLTQTVTVASLQVRRQGADDADYRIIAALS